MYTLGQIRKNSAANYLQDLSWVSSTIYTKGYVTNIFPNFAISLGGAGKFVATKNYYLRFRIKRINFDDPRFNTSIAKPLGNAPKQMMIELRLVKHDGKASNGTYEEGSYQSIVTGIDVEPYIEGINTPYYSFDIIFTPNDTYTYLGFILTRTSYDYIVEPRDDIRSNIDLGANGDLCIINNILTIPKPADKIGIQTRPGALVSINKEPIRVGRSGTYEVNSGVPITFVGITAPNGSDTKNIEPFILDYAYDA